MNVPFRFTLCRLSCWPWRLRHAGQTPPVISLDEPVQAEPLPEMPVPIEVVTIAEPLPLPEQLKPVPEERMRSLRLNRLMRRYVSRKPMPRHGWLRRAKAMSMRSGLAV